MKPFLFWVLDRILLLLALLYVLVDMTLSNYEKCILLAVIGNMIVLKNIKDVIQDGFKNLGNCKSSNEET